MGASFFYRAAQGVRLPRKKARKPPVLLGKQDIRRVIEALPEPTSGTSRRASRIAVLIELAHYLAVVGKR